MKTPVVAVLDVGKTNKKSILFDREFHVLTEQRTTFELGERDGFEIEATAELVEWFKGTLKTFSSDFDIRAIAVSSQGATVALLNAEGKLAYPVISYTSPKGAEVQEEFYQVYGDRRTLHAATSTADIGFANIAKALHYLKTRMPAVWANCKHAMFYDTYLAYELCGVMGMETTYAGNHTYLWNYRDQTWSDVAKQIGADKMFPSLLCKPWDCLGTVKPDIAEACGLDKDCRVTFGIHDSNANFLPYLAKGYGNFILNSTGTWCVAMKGNVSASARPWLTPEEIDANLFFNLDALGNPALTALFPGGMEYEKFSGFSNLKDSGDMEAAKTVIAEKKIFVVPGALPDVRVFSGTDAKVVSGDHTWLMRDLEAASDKPITALGTPYFAALNLGLALESQEMLRRCGAGNGTVVFIEGGFAKNPVYCQALANLCPEYVITLTSMKEGTSLGAALTAWKLVEDKPLEEIGKDIVIETTAVKPCDLGDLDGYAKAFKAIF